MRRRLPWLLGALAVAGPGCSVLSDTEFRIEPAPDAGAQDAAVGDDVGGCVSLDSRTLCAAPCGRDADCEAPALCALIDGDDGQATLCTDPRGRSPADAACTSNGQCESGICTPRGDGSTRCGRLCASDVDCPVGACVPLQSGAIAICD